MTPESKNFKWTPHWGTVDWIKEVYGILRPGAGDLLAVEAVFDLQGLDGRWFAPDPDRKISRNLDFRFGDSKGRWGIDRHAAGQLAYLDGERLWIISTARKFWDSIIPLAEPEVAWLGSLSSSGWVSSASWWRRSRMAYGRKPRLLTGRVPRLEPPENRLDLLVLSQVMEPLGRPWGFPV